MPLTLSYDIQTQNANDRSYIRSMLERFNWRRLGGSVFRYTGRQMQDGSNYEDWLNDVVPAIMFMRSYVLRHGITLRFLTIDASSVSFLDHTDPKCPLGSPPCGGDKLALVDPTNKQSSERAIRDFVDAAVESCTRDQKAENGALGNAGAPIAPFVHPSPASLG